LRNKIAGLLSNSPVLAAAFYTDWPSDPVRRRWVQALPIIVALVVLAAYAVLLPAGRWQGDEYTVSWLVAQQGWSVFLDRVQTWSPRPIGEMVTFLYFVLSNALDRPIIGYFLAFVWLASLVGVIIAGWTGAIRRPVTLAVLLFALTLLLAKPGEMFYWPMGASAYLPCWAALAAATVLHRTSVVRHRIALTVALLVAAWSMEVGAVTVLIYSGLVVAASLRDRPLLRRMIPVMLAAFGALLVCVTILRHRMQANEVFDVTSGLAGHWVASFFAALPTFTREAVGIAGMPLLAGFVVKLLLLVCLPAGDTQTQRDRRLGVIWGLALLLGAFASVVLAYHQFGARCCERHATLRQGMVLLALATFAGLLGNAVRPSRPVLLAVLLLVLFAVRVGPLSGDWRQLGAVVAVRQGNWDAATGPGDSMTLLMARGGHITNSDGLPTGTFRRSSNPGMGDTPWYAWGIMARFDKHALTVTEAPK
jgi:hypothetical protein